MRRDEAVQTPGFRCVPTVRVASAGRRGGRAVKASGFTLIEVLLATVLLVAGLALAFATLGAASKTAQRGEAMARHGERERAVEGFLRRRLSAARPVTFGLDQDKALPQRFIGEPDRLRFVADLPDYLGRGGPYLHDLAVEKNGDGVRLTLALSMVLAGETVEEQKEARPPEVLVRGSRSVRWRYRALSEGGRGEIGRSGSGRLGPWQDRWQTIDQLPLLVEVTMTDLDGRTWPPLVVALPLAAATTGSAGMEAAQ